MTNEKIADWLLSLIDVVEEMQNYTNAPISTNEKLRQIRADIIMTQMETTE